MVNMTPKAKQKSLAERWRAKEQCLKVAMSGFFAFCRRKTGKVVSKQISGYLKENMESFGNPED